MRNLSYDVFALRKKTAIKLLLKSLIWAFALFGVVFIILLTAVLGLLRIDGGMPVVMPKQAILTIDLDLPFAEVRPDSLLTDINEENNASFIDLLDMIAVASADDRVRALVAKIGNSPLSLAQLEEVKAEIENFKRSGKKAYLFSDGFGVFGNGMAEYYLATSFDEVVLQPKGEVGITGVNIEIPFVRKLLDKIGVEPEFYARHEYKNAFASFTDKTMSKEMRDEVYKLGRSLFMQMAAPMAYQRDIKSDDMLDLIDRAPIAAEEALKERLVDKLEYHEHMLKRLEKEYKAERFSAKDYFYLMQPLKNPEYKIAILVISGEIVSGDSVLNPLRGEAVVGADTVLAQLKEIAELEGLKALILRIDSPGGSFIAADSIRQAIEDFKTETKVPVVASMSSYAASGGYLIALPADKIIADAATLTGSIGVLGGKPVLAEMWKKLDVAWDGVKFGHNAGILSFNHRFSKDERAVFNRSLDRVYDDFVLQTAKARGIPLAKMNELARGRVWTGEQAVKNGLIDETGGYFKALLLARELAKIDLQTIVNKVVYPRPKTMQEKIAEVMGGVPTILANKLKTQIGLDNTSISMLKRLQYDAAMMPLTVNY